jgi:hypothetical protein
VIVETAIPIGGHAEETALKEGCSAEAAARAAADLCNRLEDRVLVRAPRQNSTLLRRSLNGAAIAVDPESAERRRHRACESRHVSLRPQLDGMAELGVLLPAPDAVQIYNVLSEHARVGRASGDVRTLDQLRADVLVWLLGESLVNGPAATPPHRRGRASGHAQVQITVGLGTLLRLDQEPAELTGYGPIPAELAREIAFDRSSTWRRLVTDPLSGSLLDHGCTKYSPPRALKDHVIARDRTCTFPGCFELAGRCDIDHIMPFPRGAT